MASSMNENIRSGDVSARIWTSTFAACGLFAMISAFVLDIEGFSRSVSATVLFSGVVLFNAGMGAALLRATTGVSMTARDVQQFQWYSRAGTMPLSALLVTIFVAPDMWAAVSRSGEANAVFLLVAGFLTVGLFLEFVLYRLRPLLDDELSRSYVANAMGWGFVAGFIGIGIVLTLMLISLQHGVMAILPTMVMSVWVAGLRLSFLMALAGQD